MKQYRISVLLSLVFVVLLAGCKKHETGTLILRISPKYGNQYFALDSSNTDPANRNIKVTTLQFYLSHMYLVTTNNALVKLTDVAFFNMSNASTLQIQANDLNGDFKGLALGCGLDSVMDTINLHSANIPAGLAAGMPFMFGPQPFTNTSINFSGNWDSTGIPGYPYGFFYHIVGANYYRTAQVSGSFSVCCGNTVTKTLYIDLEKVFYQGGNQVLNLSSQSNTISDPSINDTAIASQFATNFAESFSLQ